MPKRPEHAACGPHCRSRCVGKFTIAVRYQIPRPQTTSTFGALQVPLLSPVDTQITSQHAIVRAPERRFRFARRECGFLVVESVGSSAQERCRRPWLRVCRRSPGSHVAADRQRRRFKLAVDNRCRPRLAANVVVGRRRAGPRRFSSADIELANDRRIASRCDAGRSRSAGRWPTGRGVVARGRANRRSPC